MPSGVTLAVVKSQVMAEESSADDLLLQGYLDAAEQHVTDYLRRDLDVDYPLEWPKPLQQAVKMIVGHWYEHRSVADKAGVEVPFGAKSLMAAYRMFT